MGKTTPDRVCDAVRAYENGDASAEVTITTIHDLCGKRLDLYSLENYWRSESLDTFAARLAQPPIVDWESIDDDRALDMILQIMTDFCNDSIIERNCDALAKRYRKTPGDIQSIVNQFTLEHAGEALAVIKKDSVTRL